MKWDGTMWSRSALAELSQERALMGQLGPRHGNADGGDKGKIGNYWGVSFYQRQG